MKKIFLCCCCVLLTSISYDLDRDETLLSNQFRVNTQTVIKEHLVATKSKQNTNKVKRLNIPLYQEGNTLNSSLKTVVQVNQPSKKFVGRINQLRPADFVGPKNILDPTKFVGPIKARRLENNKLPAKRRIDITDHIRILQIIVDNIDLNNLEVDNLELDRFEMQVSKMLLETSRKKNQISQKNVTLETKDKPLPVDKVGYWQTVYSIESKQGKLLYRPRNKARSCTYTHGPCGHHQLTVKALKDIGCKTLQCRKDRLNYKKSLSLSKKLLALNEKRLRKNGLTNLEGYQKYLIHQQGANGIKSIIAATQGKKQLPKNIKKNMANNSPYSYKQYKKMGSKIAAKKFMQHWEQKWINEKRLILASANNSTNSLKKSRVIPTFSDNDLNFALNMKF